MSEISPEILNTNPDLSQNDIEDSEVFTSFTDPMKKWWISEFGEYIDQNNGLFTPPQVGAIPKIQSDKNTLISSETGTGKTLASFSSIIDTLLKKSMNNQLENSVYCLYISPLKSLANDIHRNLETPLEGVQEFVEGEHGIRHAIRHGDTSDNERKKMLEETPHILNTTPETLAILLNSPRFREKLRTVEYVIVDEIHSLASNKRGVHLSISLERLEQLANQSPTRIGCSATVEPLEEVAKFLVGLEDGEYREYELVDTRFSREYNIEVECPVDDLVTTSSAVITEEFYKRIAQIIENSSTTLVFTNSRSGAENTLQNLRERFEEKFTEENSACHHGSLSKEKREEVESGLKTGAYKFVTTSTSLELGIDMHDIDVVVQVGSPKSIASFLQRIGRAGHQLGDLIDGRMIVLDRDELIECSVMATRAEEGHIDRLFIPENCQDVAAQHIYGMAINGPMPEKIVKRTIRNAYPYQNYSDDEYELLIKYLRSEYDGLEDHNVYPKIWRDENDPPDGEYHYDEYDVGETLIGKRGKKAQMIYMTNIGTIPDSFTIDVFRRGTDEWIGDLDEEYLDTLSKGDVFVLGGQQYRYIYRRGSKAYVEVTNEPPTVPSWFSERLPLSYDLGKEILKFQEKIIDLITSDDKSPKKWAANLPINENARDALIDLYKRQIKYAGKKSVSTTKSISIEETVNVKKRKREIFVHTCYGRRFNDGLSRIIGQKITETNPVNVEITVNDQGFSLQFPLTTEVPVKRILESIKPNEVKPLLRSSLSNSDFLKRYFRINAVRSLLILRNYNNRTKSASQQQVSSEMLLGTVQDYDSFAVLEETYREIMEDKLDLNNIKSFMKSVQTGSKKLHYTSPPSPSPRSFGLAVLSSSDVVISEDESKVLEEFHEQVTEHISE